MGITIEITLFFILAIPFYVCSQQPEYLGDDFVIVYGDALKSIESIRIDSFIVISNVRKQPRFTIPIDSMQKHIFYPPMERDNLVGGDLYGYFNVSATGMIDSVWIEGETYPGIKKEVTRFLRNLSITKPARKRGRKVPCVCRLAFHFRAKEQER